MMTENLMRLVSNASLQNSDRLWLMDKVEYTEQEMSLIDPKPGTKAAAARDFGIDLSLTVSNLRLTPEERIKQLDDYVDGIQALRRSLRIISRASERTA